jgi:hypothetical protein
MDRGCKIQGIIRGELANYVLELTQKAAPKSPKIRGFRSIEIVMV